MSWIETLGWEIDVLDNPVGFPKAELDPLDNLTRCTYPETDDRGMRAGLMMGMMEGVRDRQTLVKDAEKEKDGNQTPAQVEVGSAFPRPRILCSFGA